MSYKSIDNDMFDQMEEPVQCPKCKRIVELSDCSESRLSKEMYCDRCTDIENEVKDLLDEAKDIQYDLDSNAEHMKGNRRGWKKNLKDIKSKIENLGYDYDYLSL